MRPLVVVYTLIERPNLVRDLLEESLPVKISRRRRLNLDTGPLVVDGNPLDTLGGNPLLQTLVVLGPLVVLAELAFAEITTRVELTSADMLGLDGLTGLISLIRYFARVLVC